jgi:hypothetical protein
LSLLPPPPLPPELLPDVVDEDEEFIDACEEEEEKEILAAATNPAKKAFLDPTVLGLLLLSNTTPLGLAFLVVGFKASVSADACLLKSLAACPKCSFLPSSVNCPRYFNSD